MPQASTYLYLMPVSINNKLKTWVGSFYAPCTYSSDQWYNATTWLKMQTDEMAITRTYEDLVM